MIKIHYPVHEFRMKKENNREMIFDESRKTWLKLTPEEWVRQNFIRYLIYSKNYPSSLVSLAYGLTKPNAEAQRSAELAEKNERINYKRVAGSG